MDSEIVDRVKELVERASNPVVEVKGESGLYYLHREASGEWAQQRKRFHFKRILLSLASVADFARANPTAGGLWYSRAGVSYVYTDTQGDESTYGAMDAATLTLKPSKQIELLSRWSEDRCPRKQEDAVRLLRTVFRDQVEPATLAEALAAINWKVDDSGKSVIGQGTRSVGRSLEQKIEGRDKLPEVVRFQVPVWETGGPTLTSLSFPVGAVLEADAATQTFTFLPFAGGVEGAWAAAEAMLADRLRGHVEMAFEKRDDEEEAPEWPPIFHGAPQA